MIERNCGECRPWAKNKAMIDICVTLLKHVKQELVDGLVGCFTEVLKLTKVIPIHNSLDLEKIMQLHTP